MLRKRMRPMKPRRVSNATAYDASEWFTSERVEEKMFPHGRLVVTPGDHAS